MFRVLQLTPCSFSTQSVDDLAKQRCTILPGSAGSLPAVFGSLPNTISSASCRRVQAGSPRSPDEYSPRSPESLRYVNSKGESKLVNDNRQFGRRLAAESSDRGF